MNRQKKAHDASASHGNGPTFAALDKTVSTSERHTKDAYSVHHYGPASVDNARTPAVSDVPNVPNRMRRLVAAGVGLGLGALPFLPADGFMRTVLAATSTSTPGGQAAAIDAPSRLAFLKLSTFLCGVDKVDEEQADALLRAHLAHDSAFGSACQQLSAWVDARNPAPEALQAALDQAGVPFAKLPRRIVTGWFIGVVGDGAAAQCVTYVSSLMFRFVEDRLRPPSYAYGPYGSWHVDPTSVRLPPLLS